jgi:hypothetical protein
LILENLAGKGVILRTCKRRAKLINYEALAKSQTADIHIKNLPLRAWRIAKSAAIFEGQSVAMWVAKAIFEKWERTDKQLE